MSCLSYVGARGGRLTKDCSRTWSFGFQFRLGKHFSDERGLLFYYLKIGFLEFLRISSEIRYPNGPIGYWKKVTIWKEACIVHVGAVIHDYQGEGASRSKSATHGKIALAHKHNWASITSTSAREVARTSARRLGHPARAGVFLKKIVCLPPLVGDDLRIIRVNIGVGCWVSWSLCANDLVMCTCK